MLSGASTVSMVNRRNLPSMHVRSVMVGVRCGAVIRETPVTAFAIVFFGGAVCDGVSIDHELVWLLDVCLCERQPAEAVFSHDVDQCV